MLSIEEKIRITGVIDSLGVRWEELNDLGNIDGAKVVLKDYQSLILWLISTGWRDYLPDGAELPDSYMPMEYLKMIKAIKP